MNIRLCTNCGRYVEESDMEKINGKYYCYLCFDFCKDCGKPFPTNDSSDSFCEKCHSEHQDR